MKKLTTWTGCLLCLVMLLSGCQLDYDLFAGEDDVMHTIDKGNKEIISYTETDADVLTSVWVATELSFESNQEYNTAKAAEYDVIMDAVFTNRSTGTSLTIPAFFDGKQTWRVRFAPTETGIWEYKTVCATDATLDGKTGTVGASTYTGDLAVYQHGFVTTKHGKKYFTYDDGTPFYYLGDTHWNMCKEEFDSPGSNAADTGATSHFCYIVDKRIEQGFTVYQSEPISFPVDLTGGKMMKNTYAGFQTADKYFKYLADKGMTHANAQFFFCTSLSDELAANEAYLEQLSRYWVARYGAYPVMWTLAQEMDNDMYVENGNRTFKWDYRNNPWVKVAEFLHKYDAYCHPLTGHQESADNTTVTGTGITNTRIDGGGMSVFFRDSVTQKTGHSWYAAQWKHKLNRLPSFGTARDYWNSPKVAVNYEDWYVNLWTNDDGARKRAWISMLNGFAGYGYGCADIWLYKGNYDMDKDTVRYDGISTVTVADKQMKWGDSLDLISAKQVVYMKNFLTSFDWWNLVPDFDDGKHFVPQKAGAMGGDETYYSCSYVEGEIILVFVYSQNKACGTIVGLDPAKTYTSQWFNTRTGAFEGEPQTFKPDANGTRAFDEKPDEYDWVLVVRNA